MGPNHCAFSVDNNYSDMGSLKVKFLSGGVGDHLFSVHSE